MPRNSNDNGRAFEYAFLISLQQYLCNANCNVTITINSSYYAARNAFSNISESLREILNRASNTAIIKLQSLEPIMFEDIENIIEIGIQSDHAGIEGDVRDIIVKRANLEWNIGFSLKHNHFAAKHSRLSKELDFALSWFGINCSDSYWAEVEPIFTMLEDYGSGTLWSSICNKEENIYIPILNAFINEIERCNTYFISQNQSLATKMVEYLLGRYDFYKIISVDKKCKTLIQPYNMRGTLNKNGANINVEIRIPITSLPTRINYIGLKADSKTTVELCCDNGWYFTFRIHNASRRVEPSLKFDIQIAGIPTTIMTLNCQW